MNYKYHPDFEDRRWWKDLIIIVVISIILIAFMISPSICSGTATL